MQRWLLKTEPTTFGVADLERTPRRTTHWDGVRNFQVRNMMRDEMRRGDQALLYHSSCEVPGVVAIVEIVRQAYPDPTALDPEDAHYDPQSDPRQPRWLMFDVQLKRRLARVITLAELRAHASRELRGMALLKRGNRLSITPVEPAHWRFILSLE